MKGCGSVYAFIAQLVVQLICNQQVGGSSPRGITIGNTGFGVSPCNVAPTKIPNGDPLKKKLNRLGDMLILVDRILSLFAGLLCGSSAIGSASPCQGGGCWFESNWELGIVTRLLSCMMKYVIGLVTVTYGVRCWLSSYLKPTKVLD